MYTTSHVYLSNACYHLKFSNKYAKLMTKVLFMTTMKLSIQRVGRLLKCLFKFCFYFIFSSCLLSFVVVPKIVRQNDYQKTPKSQTPPSRTLHLSSPSSFHLPTYTSYIHTIVQKESQPSKAGLRVL